MQTPAHVRTSGGSELQALRRTSGATRRSVLRRKCRYARKTAIARAAQLTVYGSTIGTAGSNASPAIAIVKTPA